jgi:hypothetical protein
MGGWRLCNCSTPAPDSNTTLGGFLSHRDEPASHQRDARRRAASRTWPIRRLGGLACTNASEGDSRVFLNSWNAAYAMGLLSAELITTVQEIAGEYDLPESFIEALAPAE